jgi:hypothetical protein
VLAAPTLVPEIGASPAGPTAVATFQPPALSDHEVIDLVASRQITSAENASVRQTAAQWSAQYRGDGTWLVRGGEAAWLIFEQSRAIMPANLAAINLQAPAARRPRR